MAGLLSQMEPYKKDTLVLRIVCHKKDIPLIDNTHNAFVHLSANSVIAFGWNAAALIIGDGGVKPRVIQGLKDIHAFSLKRQTDFYTN